MSSPWPRARAHAYAPIAAPPGASPTSAATSPTKPARAGTSPWACARVPSRATLALVLLATAACAVAYAGLSSSYPRARAAAERVDAAHHAVRERLTVLGAIAVYARAVFIVPLLQAFVAVAAFLSALVAADRLFHVYVAVYWRVFSHADPVDRWAKTDFPPMSEVNASNVRDFPMVVVQLPMFNEKEVCGNVIDAACSLEWPRSRCLIQILDDSTCAETRARVDDKVFEWRERGVNITHRWRSNRQGYKAGAMAEAMDDLAEYEFAAVFDADFDPSPDFLYRTVPYLSANPRVGFVQARWTFANGDESTLTRVQEISLNYHMRCEQYARHAAGLFFNFNGTSGCWRLGCVDDAGGWDCRTTVEDMDLSLRAYLRGWKFIFLDDVTCVNEIPAGYDAYRKQQHRWSCGPMQLWRKATFAIWTSDARVAKKLYLIFFFFGTRMFATHVVSFALYCLLIPICATAPEVVIPFWALVYTPLLVTLSTVAFTKRGWTSAVPYVLYENAMSIVKTTAMLAGLLEWSNAHEWVVTTKLGKWVANKVDKASKGRLAAVAAKAVAPVAPKKTYGKECAMGVFFLLCAAYGAWAHDAWKYAIFLCMQGGVFLAFGLNRVDGN